MKCQQDLARSSVSLGNSWIEDGQRVFLSSSTVWRRCWGQHFNRFKLKLSWQPISKFYPNNSFSYANYHEQIASNNEKKKKSTWVDTFIIISSFRSLLITGSCQTYLRHYVVSLAIVLRKSIALWTVLNGKDEHALLAAENCLTVTVTSIHIYPFDKLIQCADRTRSSIDRTTIEY